MKYKYLLLLCLICFSMNGQIANLSKLSKGKFYSYSVIKDKNNFIKGYFLVFEMDKVAKETFELEYVILDENLTKVTNGFITEMKFESWLIKAANISMSVTLCKDKLLLELQDNLKPPAQQGIFTRYRLLDIPTNSIGKPFVYVKDSLKVDPVVSRDYSDVEENSSEKINAFQEIGLVVDSNIMNKRKGRTKRHLKHYDMNYNEVWDYVYNDIADKELKNLAYLNSDEDVLLMFNHTSKKDTYIPEVSVLLIDSKSGKLRNEFQYPALDKFSYMITDCKITEDKIILMGNYYSGNKYGTIDDLKNLGLYRYVLDKATGKVISSDYCKWESLKGKLNIDKWGYVKKEGYLYTHHMLLNDNGDVIVVAEAFFNQPVTTNNLYFLTLDNTLAVKDVFEVTKFKNKLSGSNLFSGDIKRFGGFDFIDYQDLGDDEYLFFFNDNEKNSSKRNKSTLYGIVSYSDGKFKRQTLDLKTETSSISAYNAKKGYMLLFENFDGDKPSELRLEKINY